jgi:excisionase family DNA binding protein
MAERLPVFLPTGPVAVPRPPGLHRATYRRLVREYNRLLTKLAELPRRRLWPHLRKAYQRQFENRILRIRRTLHLPTLHPRAKPWYRTTEAALYLGISSKTLVRWTNQGIVRCHRAGYWAHRHYPVGELARVRRRLKV